MRNRKTGTFLTEQGEWTFDKRLAGDFLSDGKCVTALDGRNPEDVEWYYSFDHGSERYDFTIPIAWQALQPV